MVDSFLEWHCLTPTMVEKHGLEQVHFDLTTPRRWEALAFGLIRL